MADTYFEIYASVLPEHPLFVKCDACGDIHEQGQEILGMVSQLADICGMNLSSAQTPPEVLGFVLSVLTGATVVGMVANLTRNSEVQTAYELVPQIRSIVEDMIARLPAELDRITAVATSLAKGGVAGTC